MGEENVIQLNVQLPVQSLQGFTDMLRQLRQLAATLRGGTGAGEERMENSSFDEERFLSMHGAPAARSVRADVEAAGAASAFRQAQAQVPDPDTAGEELSGSAPEEPVQAYHEDPKEERQEDLKGRQRDVQEDISADSSAVRARADSPVPDPPRAEGEPESAIPEAEAVWAQTAERQMDAHAAAAGEVAGPEDPAGAGFQMTEGPAAAASRWSGVTEELAAAGPAPLTAEAVSQAFRRDGRRYDNGFPLY